MSFENIRLSVYSSVILKYRGWADVVWSLLSSSNSWQDICWAEDWRSRKINCLLVANLLKTIFLCPVGKLLKLWPFYNSKDNVPYWEKLHNHFWLRENIFDVLSTSQLKMFGEFPSIVVCEENWSLNCKINFIFIFNRKNNNLLGCVSGVCAWILFCWEIKYQKTDTFWPQIVQTSHNNISGKLSTFLSSLFHSERVDSHSLFGSSTVWGGVWQITVNGVRVLDNLF